MDQPEQPPGKSMQEQARAAADQIIENMRASHQSEMARINLIKDDNERLRARALLEQQEVEKIRSEMKEQLRDVADRGRAESPEDKKIKAEKAKHIFLKAKALEDEGVKVGDAKSQQVFNKIVEYIKNGQISDEGALVLERNIGNNLIEGIVFSKHGEPPSTFEKNLSIAYGADPNAATPLIRDLLENQDIYGYEGTPQDLRQKIESIIPKNNQQESQKTLNQNPEEDEDSQLMKLDDDPTIDSELKLSSYLGELRQYYLSRFTQDQIELIKSFYSPTAFVKYLERLSNGDKNGDGKFILTPDKVQSRKKEIERNIKEYYEKNNKSFKPGEDLQILVERQWGEEVSKNMEWNISDVINQLFLELQEKSSDKFYEQIMQEDIFQGPSQIQHRIQSAINNLMTKMEQIEGDGSELAERIKKLNLYEQEAADSFVEERGDTENKKIYPRIHPFAYGKKIGATDFIRHIYHTIDQTISKAEYFHNSRAIYVHPPGEKGFYQQLGDFAEHMKGGGIDEILMLPDGSYIMEAYQLYEKMLQEDFAYLDHRHRPDQLSNKLERVNSGIELQVFAQLKEFYPELSDERLRNIVNSGVGISRGIFLTESEKSAYADPIDSEGKGMIASYSTNDAGSLNVFNPMHTILRWQGEHFMNLTYFMPVNGQPGPWNHHRAMDNAAKYMDSLLVGKGRGTGKNALPEEMFIDSMMDLTNVGGPGKRKGWRTKYSLEGHFSYDPDGTINAPKTFKAMEAIGYEAIFNFYTTEQAGKKLMKATEKTDPAQAKEKKDLFRYIFKRYFSENPENFQEAELDNYLSNLQTKGEEKALDRLKTKGQPSISGSWEEQVAYETYQLFMENTLARYTAARFPTIFLRMDKNRLHDDGISHWEKIRREFKDWKREDFDRSIKNLTMAEVLLRRQISGKIRDNIKLDEKWSLAKFDDIDVGYRLNEDKIRELLSKNKKGETFKSEKEIEDAIKVFRRIKDSFKKDNFLDNEGIKRMQNYTFTFGLEDTDISLMNFRGTGPRMVARAVKDVASAEQAITPWIIEMPRILNEIAINGKHDFSEIIKYMRAAQKAITEIHDVPSTYEHMYKIAGTVINYFKKDAMAKPLFGLFGIGKKNSFAAEYAGRSTAVWEWDSRDIDRFCVALESYGLLKNSPYDLHKFDKGKFTGGDLEDRWVKIPGIKKPIKFGKKRHVDYEYNSIKLRKEHGADLKAMTWDWINQLLPILGIFLLYEYIKKALEEAEGKKK